MNPANPILQSIPEAPAVVVSVPKPTHETFNPEEGMTDGQLYVADKLQKVTDMYTYNIENAPTEEMMKGSLYFYDKTFGSGEGGNIPEVTKRLFGKSTSDLKTAYSWVMESAKQLTSHDLIDKLNGMSKEEFNKAALEHAYKTGKRSKFKDYYNFKEDKSKGRADHRAIGSMGFPGGASISAPNLDKWEAPSELTDEERKAYISSQLTQTPSIALGMAGKELNPEQMKELMGAGIAKRGGDIKNRFLKYFDVQTPHAAPPSAQATVLNTEVSGLNVKGVVDSNLLTIDDTTYATMLNALDSMQVRKDEGSLHYLLRSSVGVFTDKMKNVTKWLVEGQGYDILHMRNNAEAVYRDLSLIGDGESVFDQNGMVRSKYREKALEYLHTKQEMPRGVLESYDQMENPFLKNNNPFTDISDKEWLENGAYDYYTAGQNNIRHERKVRKLDQVIRTDYRGSYGKKMEFTGNVIATIVDMGTTMGISLIPSIGVPLAAGTLYASEQYDLETQAIDAGVDPEHARFWSSALSIPYAMSEYSQIKALEPKVWRPMLEDIMKNPKLLHKSILVGLGAKTEGEAFTKSEVALLKKAQWKHIINNYIKTNIHETGEEYVQSGIEYGYWATLYLSNPNAVDLNEKSLNMFKQMVDATMVMPFVTLFGQGVMHVAARYNGQADTIEELQGQSRDNAMLYLANNSVLNQLGKNSRYVKLSDVPPELIKRVESIFSVKGEKYTWNEDINRTKQIKFQSEEGEAINDDEIENLRRDLIKMGYANPDEVIYNVRNLLQKKEEILNEIRSNISDDVAARLEAIKEGEAFQPEELPIKYAAVEHSYNALKGFGVDINLDIVKDPKEAEEKYGATFDDPSKVRGFYNMDSQTVVLIDSNITDAQDALNAFIHEPMHKNVQTEKRLADVVKGAMLAKFSKLSDGDLSAVLREALISKEGYTKEIVDRLTDTEVYAEIGAVAISQMVGKEYSENAEGGNAAFNAVVEYFIKGGDDNITEATEKEIQAYLQAVLMVNKGVTEADVTIPESPEFLESEYLKNEVYNVLGIAIDHNITSRLDALYNERKQEIDNLNQRKEEISKKMEGVKNSDLDDDIKNEMLDGYQTEIDSIGKMISSKEINFINRDEVRNDVDKSIKDVINILIEELGVNIDIAKSLILEVLDESIMSIRSAEGGIKNNSIRNFASELITRSRYKYNALYNPKRINIDQSVKDVAERLNVNEKDARDFINYTLEHVLSENNDGDELVKALKNRDSDELSKLITDRTVDLYTGNRNPTTRSQNLNPVRETAIRVVMLRRAGKNAEADELLNSNDSIKEDVLKAVEGIESELEASPNLSVRQAELWAQARSALAESRERLKGVNIEASKLVGRAKKDAEFERKMREFARLVLTPADVREFNFAEASLAMNKEIEKAAELGTPKEELVSKLVEVLNDVLEGHESEIENIVKRISNIESVKVERNEGESVLETPTGIAVARELIKGLVKDFKSYLPTRSALVSRGMSQIWRMQTKDDLVEFAARNIAKIAYRPSDIEAKKSLNGLFNLIKKGSRNLAWFERDLSGKDLKRVNEWKRLHNLSRKAANKEILKRTEELEKLQNANESPSIEELDNAIQGLKDAQYFAGLKNEVPSAWNAALKYAEGEMDTKRQAEAKSKKDALEREKKALLNNLERRKPKNISFLGTMNLYDVMESIFGHGETATKMINKIRILIDGGVETAGRFKQEYGAKKFYDRLSARTGIKINKLRRMVIRFNETDDRFNGAYLKNENLRLSSDVAMNLVLAWRQEELREKVESAFDIKMIMERLTDIEQSIMDVLTGLYEESGLELRLFVEEKLGLIFKDVENYAPVSLESVTAPSAGKNIRPNIVPGSILERTKNSRDIDPTIGAMQIFEAHMSNIAVAMGMFDAVSYMKYNVLSPEILKEVKRLYGDDAEKILREFTISAVTQKTARQATIKSENRFVKTMLTAQMVPLFLNFKSAFRQLSSIHAFALEEDIGFGEVFDGIIHYNNPEYRKYRKMIMDTATMIERKEGAAMRELGQAIGEAEGNIDLVFERFNDIGLRPNRAVDLFTIGITAPAILKNQIERLNAQGVFGGDQAKIEHEAMVRVLGYINSTQQSSQIAYRSHSHLQHGPIRSLAQPFTSTLQQFASKEAEAYNKWKNAEGKVEKAEAWKRLCKVAFINHVLTPIFYVMLGTAFEGVFFGYDDDWKKEFMVNLITGMLIGPFSGVLFYGPLIKGGIDFTFRKGAGLPTYSNDIMGGNVNQTLDPRRTYRYFNELGTALKDAQFSDPDSLLEVVYDMFGFLPPVRDVKKAIENRK